MLKNFNPIIQDIPTIYSEDVYLLADSGKVLAGRHRSKPPTNIFSLIEKQELRFVYDNMFFAGLHPLLLVESELGPIFIDDSLFGTYRTFIAIVPHFSRIEVLSMVKERLRSRVLPSSKMKEELEHIVGIEFDECHENFIKRLLNTHRGPSYYRVHGRTNGEISMLMSEIAYDYSDFCGCELKLNISGIGLYEMKNDLCIDSYIFALTSLLFLARNYSMKRRAKMDVFFNEMGIYFDFGFEVVSEYKRVKLLFESNELRNFQFRSSNRLFDCDFYQNDRVFAVRCYPWYRNPNSANIKAPRKEFIYDI